MIASRLLELFPRPLSGISVEISKGRKRVTYRGNFHDEQGSAQSSTNQIFYASLRHKPRHKPCCAPLKMAWGDVAKAASWPLWSVSIPNNTKLYSAIRVADADELQLDPRKQLSIHIYLKQKPLTDASLPPSLNAPQ